MTDDDIIKYWQAFQTTSGSTPRSIKDRIITLRAMLRRTGATLTTVTRHHLIFDLGRPGIAASTRAHYRSFMYTFFTWMQDENFRLDNPAAKLPRVRVPRTEPNPVTTAQIEQVLHSGIYRRTRLWVLLYAYQGFRATEIAHVAANTIDWDRQRILSSGGKGGVEVWRPLHPVVWRELQQWRDAGGWLFPSPYRPGNPITAQNVSNVLSKAFKRAGIPHRPHQMRAWYATEMIDAGVPTIIVAAAMRHADTETVQRYVSVRDDAIQNAMLTLPVVRVPDRSGRKVA